MPRLLGWFLRLFLARFWPALVARFFGQKKQFWQFHWNGEIPFYSSTGRTKYTFEVLRGWRKNNKSMHLEFHVVNTPLYIYIYIYNVYAFVLRISMYASSFLNTFWILDMSSWQSIQFLPRNPMFRSKAKNSGAQGPNMKENLRKTLFDFVFVVGVFLHR